MPRHNHSGGMPGHPTRQKGGSERRAHNSKNTYDPFNRRADWQTQPDRRPALIRTTTLYIPAPLTASRKNGTTTTPQQPKPATKGGSKPIVTSRPKPVKRSISRVS